jgi:hypothetical protein
MNGPDPLLDALRALPAEDLDPATARTTHARLRRVFTEHARLSPVHARLLGVYLEVLEPVGLAGATAAYLFWAFTTASAPWR